MLEEAFKDGAAFAQRWIPVEEEMPEFSEENRGKQFLVKGFHQVNELKGEEIEKVARLDFGAYESFGGKYFGDCAGFTMTHWRYIDLK
jgi:hypothetical protein